MESLTEMVQLEVFRQTLNEAEEITREEMVEKLLDAGGSMFTVEFTKKDGSHRVLNGRFSVKKYLKGGTLPYSPADKGLIPVWDAKVGYRMINKHTITALRVKGRSYTIAGGND